MIESINGFSSIRFSRINMKIRKSEGRKEGTNCGDAKSQRHPWDYLPRSRHHRGWTDRIALAPLPFFFFSLSLFLLLLTFPIFYRILILPASSQRFRFIEKRSWDKNYEKIMEATSFHEFKEKIIFSFLHFSLFFFFFLSTLFVRLRSLNCTIVYIVIILVRRIRQVFVFGEVRGKNRENGSSTPMIMG